MFALSDPIPNSAEDGFPGLAILSLEDTTIIGNGGVTLFEEAGGKTGPAHRCRNRQRMQRWRHRRTPPARCDQETQLGEAVDGDALSFSDSMVSREATG
jgi:hypothetical protein